MKFIFSTMLSAKRINSLLFSPSRLYMVAMPILLSACGGGKPRELVDTNTIGFALDYVPPTPNFVVPLNKDPNYKKLEPPLSEPYWTVALKMSDGEEVINKLLLENGNVLKFSFPLEAPPYLPVTILGWAPANQEIRSASIQIYSRLEKVLNITIEESESFDGTNNLAIAQSIQSGSSGFGYFPNNKYELGSDVFISKEYSNPIYLPSGLTNYDYEVLLHEIGHALGLKHPFEGDRNNSSTLNLYEDSTHHTAMSYDGAPSTYSGEFRSLDWMTLTKLYGVNPEFRSGDDVYKFNDQIGTFIIDGGGIDTVSISGSENDVYLDLRSGMHSYHGQKSTFITSGNQLTISHGSEIENATTGSGEDTLIGNELANVLVSGHGDDRIFGGAGEDVIFPGSGNNIIDLSEDLQSQDKIVLETRNGNDGVNVIYGFTLGISGDIIDFSNFALDRLTYLPLIEITNVPSGYIDNCVVRVFGENLNDQSVLNSHFALNEPLAGLSLAENSSAILITAKSQGTGEDQNIYQIESSLDHIIVTEIAIISGNYLDIDNWHSDNFLV